MPLQNTGGNTGTITTAAIGNDRFLGIQPPQVLPKIRRVNMLRCRNSALSRFVVLSLRRFVALSLRHLVNEWLSHRVTVSPPHPLTL